MAKRKREENEPSSDEKPTDTAVATDGKAAQDAQAAFEIPIEGKKPLQCSRHGPTTGHPSLVFTHGASGDLKAPAMQDFAHGFSETNSLVMFKGNMNLKARVASFGRVVEHEDCRPALGGRSMGARAACLAARDDGAEVETLVLVSFPLVGKQKDGSREKDLLDLPEGVDVLFISGDNDSMCDLDHLRDVMARMKGRTWLVEVVGADHGTALRDKVGSQPVRRSTGEIAAEWLREREEGKRWMSLVWDEEEAVVVSSGWREERPTGADGGREAEGDDGEGAKGEGERSVE